MPARRRPALGSAACGLRAGAWLWLWLASTAAAQPRPATWLVIRGGAQGPHIERLRDALADAFGPLVDDPSRLARDAPDLSYERLAPLRELEGLLSLAQAQAADLQEDSALRTLAEAERLAERLLPLPGSAAWNAEVQVRIGLVAAQAGQRGLAEQALRRALRFDPGRRIGAAEAAPAVVELAAQLRREAANAARGQFVVESMPPGARVLLDDVELGRTPLRVEAPVGRHIVSLLAPDHAPTASFVDVLEGPRAPLRIVLSRTAEADARGRLLAAARAGELDGVVRELGPLSKRGAVARVLIVERAPGPDARRALLITCMPSGCRGPSRLSGEMHRITPHQWPVGEGALARARAWLREPKPARREVDEATPLWGRWYFWAGALSVATAATLVAVFTDSDEPERRLRLVVDPTDVGQ